MHLSKEQFNIQLRKIGLPDWLGLDENMWLSMTPEQQQKRYSLMEKMIEVNRNNLKKKLAMEEHKLERGY